MGRRLDALLGRTFKASKFKTLLNLAISRLAVLKNQRQVRFTQARSDVSQLLELGQQDRALLRVEHVIKEQNMLDAFIMMEGYCIILIERIALIEQQKECPDELREAVAGLIFAASRCGEFPELLEIRDVFTSRFGKDFTSAAANLRNHCGVSLKMIQKMSTRQPSLESRIKVLKEIASEKGITVDIEEPSNGVSKEDWSMIKTAENGTRPNKLDVNSIKLEVENSAETSPGDPLSGSAKARKFEDVASAAQAAFESAAQAAAAARAAVELSKSEPYNKGSSDGGNPDTSNRGQYRSNEDHEDGSFSYISGFGSKEKVTPSSNGLDFQKIHPIEHSSSESEDEIIEERKHVQPEEFKGKSKATMERNLSGSSMNLSEVTSSETNAANHRGKIAASEKEIHFDESDEETEKDQIRVCFESSKFHLDEERTSLEEVKKSPKAINRRASNNLGDSYRPEQNCTTSNEEFGGVKPHQPKGRRSQITTQADSINKWHEEFTKNSHIGKKPISVRTRRGFN